MAEPPESADVPTDSDKGGSVPDHWQTTAGRFWRQWELAGSRSRATNGQPEPFSRLTDREFEIAKLVARGMKNHEIARALHIAPATVANNLTNIYSQLDVDRSALIAMANAKGIGA